MNDWCLNTHLDCEDRAFVEVQSNLYITVTPPSEGHNMAAVYIKIQKIHIFTHRDFGPSVRQPSN